MSPFIIFLCNEQSGCRWAFFVIGILSHLIQHLITVLLMLQAKMLEPRCQLQTAWSVGDACCQEDAWGSVRLWGTIFVTKCVEIKPLSPLCSLNMSLDFCQLNSIQTLKLT